MKFQENPIQIEFADLKHIFAILIVFNRLDLKSRKDQQYVSFGLLNKSVNMISLTSVKSLPLLLENIPKTSISTVPLHV